MSWALSLGMSISPQIKAWIDDIAQEAINSVDIYSIHADQLTPLENIEYPEEGTIVHVLFTIQALNGEVVGISMEMPYNSHTMRSFRPMNLLDNETKSHLVFVSSHLEDIPATDNFSTILIEGYKI